MLKRINGGVQGYDVDAHYDILRRTVEHEMGRNGIESGRQITIWENIKSTKEIFVGTNGFRTLIAFMPAAVQQLTGLAVVRGSGMLITMNANFSRSGNILVTLLSRPGSQTLSFSPSFYPLSRSSSLCLEPSPQISSAVGCSSSARH